MNRPEKTDLSNWRKHPTNIWGFQNVDALVPTEPIAASAKPTDFSVGPELDLATIGLPDGTSCAELVKDSFTDGLLVLHQGKICSEIYFGSMQRRSRHIAFSVSKSITGLLAGILAERQLLDPEKVTGDYVPELRNSAYGDATIRQILDMEVNVRFLEDYLDPKGDVARYRVAMDWDPPVAFEYEGGLHQFLAGLPHGAGSHGERFNYCSPTTDVLGWILERAAGEKLAALLSRHLWSPIGAETAGYIAVDRFGACRPAGGICATLRDLGKIGELVRNDGQVSGRTVVPQTWLQDMRSNGNRAAWLRGDLTVLFPSARYRSKWYMPDGAPGELIAIGIHGQWIYVDTETELTIVKLSSQPLPVDEPLDLRLVDMFRAIGTHYKMIGISL